MASKPASLFTCGCVNFTGLTEKFSCGSCWPCFKRGNNPKPRQTDCEDTSENSNGSGLQIFRSLFPQKRDTTDEIILLDDIESVATAQLDEFSSVQNSSPKTRMSSNVEQTIISKQCKPSESPSRKGAKKCTTSLLDTSTLETHVEVFIHKTKMNIENTELNELSQQQEAKKSPDKHAVSDLDEISDNLVPSGDKMSISFEFHDQINKSAAFSDRSKMHINQLTEIRLENYRHIEENRVLEDSLNRDSEWTEEKSGSLVASDKFEDNSKESNEVAEDEMVVDEESFEVITDEDTDGYVYV